MAKSTEEFMAELLIPIAAIGVVFFFVQKILEWIWKSIAPYAIPILWVAGILFTLGIVFFILFKRAGMNRSAWKSLSFTFFCFGVFGVVVYCGYNDELQWAQTIVDSMSWIIKHPIITGISVVVFLILAVTVPIPGLGPVRSTIKSEFMRGMEEGMRNNGES